MPVHSAMRRFKADIFQALAHPTRIAIVDVLREGETPASKLIERLELHQANASQHLAVLRARQVVVSRKVGNQVYYSLRDPVLTQVLDLLRGYFYSQLAESATMLEGIQQEESQAREYAGVAHTLEKLDAETRRDAAAIPAR